MIWNMDNAGERDSDVEEEYIYRRGKQNRLLLDGAVCQCTGQESVWVYVCRINEPGKKGNDSEREYKPHALSKFTFGQKAGTFSCNSTEEDVC